MNENKGQKENGKYVGKEQVYTKESGSIKRNDN